MVFRTNDAEYTYQRLLRLGFEVQPVQNLSRPAQLGDRELTAEFRTVRFAKQPIEGLRIYFCEHRTPDLVWSPEWQAHANQAKSLVNIEIGYHAPNKLAQSFNQLLELSPYKKLADGSIELQLENITISLKEDQQLIPEINLVKVQMLDQLFSITKNYLKENLGNQ